MEIPAYRRGAHWKIQLVARGAWIEGEASAVLDFPLSKRVTRPPDVTVVDMAAGPLMRGAPLPDVQNTAVGGVVKSPPAAARWLARERDIGQVDRRPNQWK